MIARLKTHVLIRLLAVLVAGVAYTQIPADKTEAVIVSQQYENFSYNPATGLATWNYRLTMSDTFSQTYSFTAIGPAGSIVTAGVVFQGAVNQGAGCAGLPSPAPITCQITFPPGGNQLLLTITTPFTRQCAAQTVAIGPVSGTNTSVNNPFGTAFNLPASTTSLVGGVAVPNVIPANPAVCPVTPIPNTPVPSTATPTPLIPPVVVPVIPQVFQHVPQGIFNGSRNNTPTPVRPAVSVPITAPSTGQGPADVLVLRPPNTGDAGLLTLRMTTLSVW